MKDQFGTSLVVQWIGKQKEKKKESEVAQSCPTLCNPTDCSLPGSSVHGIFQARVLEQVAISFSRRSSQPRDRTWVSCTAGRRFTDRESTYQFRGHRFNPWSRKFSHATEQISLCATTTEIHAVLGHAAQLLSLSAATTEALIPRACASQQETPPQGEAHTRQQRGAPTCHNQRKPMHGNQNKYINK